MCLAIIFQWISIWLSKVTSTWHSQIHTVWSKMRLSCLDISLLTWGNIMTFKALNTGTLRLRSRHFMLGELGQRGHKNLLLLRLLHAHIQLGCRLIHHVHCRLLYQRHLWLLNHRHLRLLNCVNHLRYCHHQISCLNHWLNYGCVRWLRSNTCLRLHLMVVYRLNTKLNVLAIWRLSLKGISFTIFNVTWSHFPPIWMLVSRESILFWTSHSTFS